MRRFLRSPRTAAWLLGLLTAWMLLATVVPQGELTDPDVLEWREAYRAVAPITTLLGLHRAYVAPVFLVLASLLAASTAVCSWDRTRFALRVWRSLGVVDPARVSRLERAPALVVPIGECLHGTDPLDRAASVLAALGLRARTGPRLLEAHAGVRSRFASPVFHWSLVALFVVIPLGQLTISRGLIGVPVGGSVLDEPSAYGVLSRGPWNRELSGLFVAVEEMPLNHEAGGVDRGAAPLVVLSQPDGTEVARGHVYPNSPLRHGSLVVHMNDYGLALDVILQEDGQPIAQIEVLLDFDEEAPDGTTTAVLGLGDPQSEDLVEVRLTVPLDRSPDALLYHDIPPAPKVRVEVADLQTDEISSAVIEPGEWIATPVGEITVDRLDYYARLSLVDDWSIPFVYAFLTIASLTVAVSLLVPYRVVWVLRVGEPGEERLHVAVRHGRGDSGFRERVADALAEEFGADGVSSGDDRTAAPATGTGENRSDSEGDGR